ncbi:MAG: pyruvate ferredoxin oxidoreductase [bacterium]|nr:pyruvate ferredoxin oxidoreductase [bacterium]
MGKTRVARTGNEAMAEAIRQINPDVVAAYPITPATEVMQIFATYVADGLVDTELVPTESEHSAMSAAIGAQVAGARTMTATSSQGLALMYEMLYIAAGLRLPLIMAEVNRALSAPINIHCDHGDTMGGRDAGWIQIFSENSQEAYDNLIQAVRIAEHSDVLLPIMVTTDGFIISHAMEDIDIYSDGEVRDFIGTYKPLQPALDYKKPITVGSIDFVDYYFEHRRALAQAMSNAKNAILEVGREFGSKFGQEYGFYEAYKLDDAEVAMVCLGSTAGTGKDAVDNLRKRGIKAGLLKVRVFRPFPAEELAARLKDVPQICVLDRSDALAATGGPLYAELLAAMFEDRADHTVINRIYGLGGRDIKVGEIEELLSSQVSAAAGGKSIDRIGYLGVRE